jgi:hypothetical protein
MPKTQTLFRPWKVLALSAFLLYGAMRAYFMHGIEMALTTRVVLGAICCVFFFGALALLARNVLWRANDARYYHPLPKWAITPFMFLFGLLAVAFLIQVFGYFRFDDLASLVLIGTITTIGIVDIVRTQILLRTQR